MSTSMWINPKKKRVDRSESARQAPRYIKALIEVVDEFLAQLDYTQTAFYADMQDIQERKEDLRKAFSVYCASQLTKEPNVVIDDPLGRYVYIANAYRDIYDIVFEYVGEVEHQFGLNFSKKGHPYNTDKEMWREDFFLAHCEYME